MEEQIYKVTSSYWKTVAIHGEQLWLSQKSISNFDNFEKELQKKGMLKTSYTYDLYTIPHITFNTESESLSLKYQDEKGNEKKLSLEFTSSEMAAKFGNSLGEKLNLVREEKQERKIKPLATNGFFLALTLLFTIYVGTMEDPTNLAENTSGKYRGRAAIFQLIINYVGQTGVLIIGAFIALYFVYQMYIRFKNPGKVVVYHR
ncbi:MAG: hypothetical protein P1U56_15530 [Saprospiraceae bacterium]|nr:hypothetical protein [Saprospiraceae bacterium]